MFVQIVFDELLFVAKSEVFSKQPRWFGTMWARPGKNGVHQKRGPVLVRDFFSKRSPMLVFLVAGLGRATKSGIELEPPSLELGQITSQAASQDGSQSPDASAHLTFPDGRLLPAVHCIYYLTLNGTSSAALFEVQAKALGLWDRVTVQVSEADPDGKAAGCFRSHVKAWNSAVDRGCETALLLEEDVYFQEPVVEAALDYANAFVAANRSFDMLFLGYTPQVNFSQVRQEYVPVVLAVPLHSLSPPHPWHAFQSIAFIRAYAHLNPPQPIPTRATPPHRRATRNHLSTPRRCSGA